MEVIIGIVVVVALIFAYGQMSLEKPISDWSDDELARRLPKYENLLSTQMLANAWSKTDETKTRIDEIRAEIVKRRRPFEPEKVTPLKMEWLVGAASDRLTTEKEVEAADRGDTELQVLVGTGYLAGANGLPQDSGKAVHYLLKAARSDNAVAAFVVAGLYSDGIGVDEDFQKARLWAVRAQQLGAPNADQMLAATNAKRPRSGEA